MSCVCACDQRRRCLENRPIDLEPWIKFSTRTASCLYSRFSIHRHRRDVCYLKSSSANVYKKKTHLCIMWRFSVSINCNLVWIFLNGWFYFGDDDRGVGRGGIGCKGYVLKLQSDVTEHEMMIAYCYFTCQAFQCMFCMTVSTCTILVSKFI